MRIVSNAGIGDIILLHAMLEASDIPSFSLGLSDSALATRESVLYRPFAVSLMKLLFDSPRYSLDFSGCAGGIDPPTLRRMHGLPAASPDLRDKLTASECGTDSSVVVMTKIRGWDRFRYDRIRDRFIEAIKKIARRRRIVLVGERRIGVNSEYRSHGENRIYSIYDDLVGIPALDLTVPELGLTPPYFSAFLQDCAMIGRASATVALGTGGNTTMAQACGRWIGCIVATEMERYLSAMPEDPRHRLCREEEEFLAAVEALA